MYNTLFCSNKNEPPVTGLAKVAGALANVPREAMGEEVALVDPLRRKSAAGFGSFLGEKSVPAKEVCDEPTRLRETESKRQCSVRAQACNTDQEALL